MYELLYSKFYVVDILFIKRLKEIDMRIKPIYSPIMINSTVYFGIEKSLEINNVDDETKAILKKLDKGISEKELLEIDKFFDVDNFNQVVQLLRENNLIQEDVISDDDFLLRYKNNMNYFQNFSNSKLTELDIQKKLNEKKILFLGVGGSSLLASAFVGMGVENLILLDFDRIELSNLNRQFIFNESQLGKLKVDMAKNYFEKMNSKCNITAINKKIESIEDIDEIIKDVDIVINAIDTPAIESNRWVSYSCYKNKKPFFQVGVGCRTVFVEKYTFNEGCYDCFLLNQLDEIFDETKETFNLVYSNDVEIVNTSFAPNILAFSGFLSMEVFKYILNNDNHDVSYEIDLDKLSIRKYNMHMKNKNCPVCNNMKFVHIKDLYKISKEGV